MENFNRLNDLYFKKLLGDKKRKNLTLSFLNGVLNKDDKNYFTDISFLDKDNEAYQRVINWLRTDQSSRVNGTQKYLAKKVIRNFY